MFETVARRTIRLPDFDYASEGAYFVTICAYQRECVFGDVVGDAMQLNAAGKIVQEEWLQTGSKRPYVVLDEFVVMPNHFHAILFIMKSDDEAARGIRVGARRAIEPRNQRDANVGAQRAAPLQPHVTARSLGAIVRGFKSAATKRINEQRGTPGVPIWQRNYYEHVIRNELSLNDIRSYIQTNPARWAEDNENPANATTRNERI